MKEDFAETNNLAEKEKTRLIAMIGMWYNEAGKYNVLPIDSRGLQRVREERPQIAVSRNRYVLYPGTQSIPAGAAPKILNRPYSITAEVQRNHGVRLLRLNYLVQPLDLPSGRIIGLHPIAQPCEQGRECRHVSAKIGRHIA